MRSGAWARSSSTRLPWPAATTTSCSTPASGTTDSAWTDELLYERRELFEIYNKGLSLVPTAELPWYRVFWDHHRENQRYDAYNRYAATDRADPGPHPSGRAAVQPGLRGQRQDRLVLGPHHGDARRPGGARGRRLPRARPTGGQPPLLRPRGAPVPGGPCSPSTTIPRDQRRHKLLSRYRGHGLLGAGRPIGDLPGHRPGTPDAQGPARRDHPRRAAGGARGGRRAVAGDRGRRPWPALRPGRGAGPAGRDRGGARAPLPARGHLPGAPRPVRVGPRPAAVAVRLRLRLGGLRP